MTGDIPAMHCGTGHVIRLGVISNPNSGRNRRHLHSVSAMLDLAPGAVHVITSGSVDIPRAMRELAHAGVNVLAINGGDGSVAHVLGELVAGTAFPSPPLLCALPGGTTNVTVGDVGIRGSLNSSVLKLLAWARGANRTARVLERPIISVRNDAGEILGCGLVFGLGTVVDGIEYWHEQVRARGMRSEFSSGVAMIRTLWGTLRGHEDFARPLALRITSTDCATPLDGEFMLLVISSLQRLFLGIHPFWGEGERALNITAIESGAQHFVRSLPSLLRGRPARFVRSDTGYHSARLDSLELGFAGAFTLDGELHHVAPGSGPLNICAAGSARFLRI
jgi:hypothetical protein